MITRNIKQLALVNLGRYQEAITYYDKALAINPNNVDVLNAKGVATSKLTPNFKPLSYNGQNPIIRNFHLILDASPNFSGNSNYTAPFDKALELSPMDTKVLLNKGKYLADKLGKYDEAIIFYDKALKINANYAPALYNKGEAPQKLARYNEAQQYFDKAKNIDPSYGGDFINPSPHSSYSVPSAI